MTDSSGTDLPAFPATPAPAHAPSPKATTWRFAVMGNPNSGKTTIFNWLTGMHHKVANYPGVTVERREAKLAVPGAQAISLIDLPGAYSLVPRSTDERIARDALLGLLADVRTVDGVVVVIDASNLQRHLYLATQIIDLGIPALLCCNMIDSAEANWERIDVEALSRRLGVPVFPTVGNRGQGIPELAAAIAGRSLCVGHATRLSLPPAVEREMHVLGARLRDLQLSRPGREDQTALLVLCSSQVDAHQVSGQPVPEACREEVARSASRLDERGAPQWEAHIVQARYRCIREWIGEVVTVEPADRSRHSDRIDRWMTHPLSGTLTFAILMCVMFLALFSGAEPLMDFVESGIAALGQLVASWLPAGMLQSLLVDGVIAGVGAVVVFLPQICILFFFICLMEDTGYMARAALLMNRLMTAVGLPGKSFIPLLSSFACAIPGIMAARTIEHHRDRLVTILIAPFMSCSARLPVYTVIIGALFSGRVWLQTGVMLAMYVLGICTALAVAFVLKRTLLRSPPARFLIELPPYRRPHLRVILRTMWERSVLFLRDAGTIIFAASIVLWALAYFPRAESSSAADAGAQLRHSIMGRIGRAIEPAIEPLGFDWKIGVGLVASFAAREVFVSTLGIVYGLDDNAASGTAPLRDRIAADRWPDGRKIFTPLTGIGLMVFYVLACQCVSTLGVVKRETNSYRWPLFMFCYMTAFAYLASLAVHQVGLACGWGT